MVSYFTIDTSGGETNFQEEISNMMYGFGDNPNPNAATVVLIETVVSQYLRNLLQDASALSTSIGGSAITNFEIIYLMRKNKTKLMRLHDYQLKLDQIDKIIGVAAQADESINYLLLHEEVNPLMKMPRTHINIINRVIDEFHEINPIRYNDIDYLRKVRAFILTEPMSSENYKAYHNARRSSFCSGGMATGFSKFERWINPNKEFNISMLALEVLCFLARETVAEIVDAVYLVRGWNSTVCNEPGYEGMPAITVTEVQEVLMKYYSPKTGMNRLFYTNMLGIP